MIPVRYIDAWKEHAPWKTPAQIEQDLVLTRAIVEIYSDELLRNELAFRGGTALHKIYFQPPARYSEDIDLVRRNVGPVKDIMTALRDRLVWLGKPHTDQKRDSIKFIYRFESEIPPVVPLRLKIEINTREHFSVLGLDYQKVTMTHPWHSGEAQVTVYKLEELLGTKLRALYQRKKGRDLFDLHVASQKHALDPKRIVKSFEAYLVNQKIHIPRAEFEANLAEKLNEPAFGKDMNPLLASGTSWDIREAAKYTREKLLSLLADEPPRR